MAKMNELAAELQESRGAIEKPNSIQALLKTDKVKERLEEVLGEKAQGFASSLLSLVAQDQALANADPNTVLVAALSAAVLDLPVEKNLGYAYVVPYKGRAQLQIGYKGYIQMAHRTGLYKVLNVVTLYDGEFIKWDPVKEELVTDVTARASEVPVGVAAFFELNNGFTKTVFWTMDQIESHRQKYAKASNIWKTEYLAMAEKTVLKHLISRWGPLTVSFQNALNFDNEQKQETYYHTDNGAVVNLNPLEGENDPVVVDVKDGFDGFDPAEEEFEGLNLA